MRRGMIPMLVLSIAGCAQMAPRVEVPGPVLSGSVAIVASDEPPEIRFEGFPTNPAEAAAMGMSDRLTRCTGGLLPRECGISGVDRICAPFAIIMLGACGIDAVTAAAAAGTDAALIDGKRLAKVAMSGAVQSAVVQGALRDRVTSLATADGKRVAAEPSAADAVIDVAVTRVGTRGHWALDASLRFYMEARVSRLRSDGTLLHTSFAYEGRELRLSQWAADRGKALMQELEKGYDALARDVYDQAFLLYPFPYRKAYRAGHLADTFGLAPEYPPVAERPGSDEPLWLETDGLRPTFRWQAFPRKGDLERAPGDMTRVRNVRYDLVVAEAWSRTVIYRRTGLTSPTHALEMPLAPQRGYFWTVRARFELDGRERVTEWGSRYPGASKLAQKMSMLWGDSTQRVAPWSGSYRFSTPAPTVYIERGPE